MNRPARLLLVLFPVMSSVQAEPSTPEAARTLYEKGDYAGAARMCREIIAATGPTAAAWYNAGNAEFRQGNTGAAILAYERALQFAPRDSDLRANLALAREKAGLPKQPGNPWWAAPAYFASLREWSAMAVAGALCLAVAALVSGIAGWRRLWLKRSAAGGIMAGGVLLAVSCAALWLRRDEPRLAVLTEKSPQLRLSPFPAADPVGNPGTGQLVEVSESFGAWRYVRSSNGAAGWVEASGLGMIIPQE